VPETGQRLNEVICVDSCGTDQVWNENDNRCDDRVTCDLGTYYLEEMNECFECSDPECAKCPNNACEECFADHMVIEDGFCMSPCD